jgi:hypothetical protein
MSIWHRKVGMSVIAPFQCEVRLWHRAETLITLVHCRYRKNTRCRSWNLPVIGVGEPNMAARLRRWSAPLMQETCRKRWMVCSVTVGCPAADISARQDRGLLSRLLWTDQRRGSCHCSQVRGGR